VKKQSARVAEELKTAREAVKAEPSDPRHWIALGVVLLELRHWDESIRALRRGIELKPAYAEADARLFLADALEGAGRRKEARREWETVLQMEPCYPSHEEPMHTARRKLAATRK